MCDAPLCSDHQDAGEGEFKKSDTAPCVQDSAELETAPCPILFVGRGICDVFECEGECKGDGYGQAVDAKVGVVHEVRVEHDIDGG